MATLAPNDVQGSWSLESFDIERLDKSVAPWGSNTHGLLIYAPSGHMSVSINRDQGAGESEAQKIFDSILFYSGTYRIDGSEIRHVVQNASNPARIGRDMIRYASLEGDVLTLSSPEESFGHAILRWRRIK